MGNDKIFIAFHWQYAFHKYHLFLAHGTLAEEAETTVMVMQEPENGILFNQSESK